MQLIRKTRLWSQRGNSDKVYEVDLCEVGKDRYVVNFRYGRRGSKLREGSKTVQPVALAEAEEIFTSLVISKINKGYQESDNSTPTKIKSNTKPEILLKQLDRVQDAKLSRVIWRIGELRLRDALPRLRELAQQGDGDSMRDYCIAWALGRCGDTAALPTLTRLHNAGKSNAVKRMAFEAMFALADTVERDRLLNNVITVLPMAVRDNLDDADKLRAALHTHLARTEAESYVVLEQLYLIAAQNTIVRQVLLEELRTAPLKPSYFQRIRHIFKAAEFRQDSEVYGLLAYRFETESAFFYRSAWGGKYVSLPGEEYQYVKLKEEINKPNSRLAYSNRTRDYLRRRIWRTLRRLGELDDDNYVDMAAGVLLMMRDEDAAEPRQTGVYRYDWSRSWEQARQLVSTHDYDGYAGFLVFNHILHSNSPRYVLSKSGRAWEQRRVDDDMQVRLREELFPEIWDRHPEVLLRLLIESHCEPVHIFATKALRANPGYCAELEVATLATLLRSSYLVTADFALQLARARYQPEEPELALLQALLESELEVARQQALEWIAASQGILFSDSAFVVSLLSNRFADVRAWSRQQVEKTTFSAEQADALITRLLAFTLTLSTENPNHPAIAKDIGAILLQIFPERLSSLGLAVIGDLLAHPLAEVQALAGRLLINHERKAEELPPAMFKRLLEADAAEVRGLGVQLFGKLPDETLLEQYEVLATFCVAEQADVRQNAHQVAQRLAFGHADYGQRLIMDMLPYVFRKEPVEGFHTDLLNLLQSEGLAVSLAGLDRGTVWRLLKARAKAAQNLGGHILQQHIQPDELSVRQWAWLGDHPVLVVRQWSQQAYKDHSDRIKQNASDALRILDSNWDDSREFAIDYFSTHFAAADWNPELLVSICDSVRDDVQAFGRELISRFFADEYGEEYLLKLSQHPATNVQLFASNFLERFACDQPERLAALTPYFITVLSQVNRGRVAKSRILTFLHTEALKDKAAAKVAANIFNRQSVTSAITDKAACLQALRDIHAMYPDIELPLKVKPVREVARHGV